MPMACQEFAFRAGEGVRSEIRNLHYIGLCYNVFFRKKKLALSQNFVIAISPGASTIKLFTAVIVAVS
jgi:hypothetical protein